MMYTSLFYEKQSCYFLSEEQFFSFIEKFWSPTQSQVVVVISLWTNPEKKKKTLITFFYYYPIEFK